MKLEDLLPPGVADAFQLDDKPADKPAPAAVPTVAVAAVDAKRLKAPKQRKRALKHTPARSEELDVVARETGSHRDLRDVVGFLTIDYDRHGRRPYEATFDPFDEGIKNVSMPVSGWLRSDERIHVTDDEDVRWRFDIIEPPEEYEDENDGDADH